MDRNELVETLRQARIPEALYDIPGVHDIPLQPDAYYFLRPESGDWVVGLRERSQDSVLGRFAAEEEACDFLYARLMELPPPVPGGAQRIAEVLAHRDDIQRDAWRAFERALRDQETRGEGKPPAAP